MSKKPTKNISRGTSKKNPGGRPSKKDLIPKDQLKKLCLKGFTDKEIADFFGITEQTFNNWKKKDQKFFESLKGWKDEHDEKVERSLLERALGSEYDEITYEKSKVGGLGAKVEDGDISEIKNTDCFKVKVVTKKIIPDVTAQIFWLKNRKPAEWRDKHEHEHSGDLIIRYGHRNEK